MLERMEGGPATAASIAAVARIRVEVASSVLVALERRGRVHRPGGGRLYATRMQPLEGWGLWGGQGRLGP